MDEFDFNSDGEYTPDHLNEMPEDSVATRRTKRQCTKKFSIFDYEEFQDYKDFNDDDGDGDFKVEDEMF